MSRRGAYFLLEFLGQAVDLQTDAVGVIIIVAVAGGTLQHLADVFLAFEVAFQRVQQLLHGQFLVVEDQLADSRQGVDGRTVAQAFEVAEIQAAFVVVILVQVHAFLHGQHMQGHRRWAWQSAARGP